MANDRIYTIPTINYRSQVAGPNRRQHMEYRDVPIQKQILSKVYNSSIGRAIGGPSIFSKTPSGHCKEHQKTLEKLPFKYRVFLTRQRPHVPPGYVHVRLFMSLDLLRRRFWRASLEAVLPLEPNGGFDLRHIKKLWNLETCVPVSPVHWKAVEPSTPDSLSPIAVMMLLELYDCISFIEPPVSDFTQTKRAIRENVELGVEFLKSLGRKLYVSQMWFFKLVGNTSLADSVQKAREDVQYFNLRLKWWLAGLPALKRNLFFLLLIFLLCLLLHVFGFLSRYPDAPLTAEKHPLITLCIPISICDASAIIYARIIAMHYQVTTIIVYRTRDSTP
ncbi:hypothetical protein C0995_005775 [Termitomyces sp. Mi166|nr:hypothetical protein C0995_005775 [Termitomyces sp. Mi166\